MTAKGSSGPSLRSGALTIASWTAAGYAVNLAAIPVISRLYSPGEYGAYAVLVALAAVLGTATALRYEFAVPLPSDEEDARALVFLGLALCLSFVLVLTPVAWVESGKVSSLIGLETSPRIVTWVPLLAASYGAFRLLNQWAIRQAAYARAGRRNFVQAMLMAATQVGLGLRGFSSGGLLLGSISGQVAGAVSLLFGSRVFSNAVPLQHMWKIMRLYAKFAAALVPAGVINALGIYMPVLMLAALYDSHAAGTFGLAQQVVSLPLLLLGQAIGQVFLGELASRRRSSSLSLRQLFDRFSLRLWALSALVTLSLLLLPRLVLPLILGQNWSETGAVAQALALTAGIQLVSAPLSQTLIVLERTGLQLTWDVSRLLVTGSVFVLAHAVGLSSLSAIWLFSVASAFLYFWLWAMSRHCLADDDGELETSR